MHVGNHSDMIFRAGTPAQIQRPQEDPALFIQDVRHSSLRKTSGAENQLRKKMQDLVNTVDPNVKIDNEAENVRTRLFRY